MKTVSPREAALNVLCDVDEGTWLNLALKERLRAVEPEGRRFAAALCFTVLENRLRIDYALAQFEKAKRTHKAIKNILRMGVAQLDYMGSVPESAAVNESVKLAKKVKQQLAGYVNAVLRAYAAGEPAYPAMQDGAAKYFSVKYSYPEWLAAKLISDYGEADAESMMAKKSKGVCVRANRIKAESDALADELAAFLPQKGRLCGDAMYLTGMTAPEELPAFTEGRLAVQSEASMLCVRAAGIRQGMSVLDVCAAPGGKSAYAAQFSPARLVSCDVHPHRVELMKREFSRLGVEAQAIVQDAREYRREFDSGFDRVLVDAPCTALGLLYRKPDIKINKRPEELEEILPLQSAILDNCARYVRPGGILLYSTCTVNPRENIKQIKAFLQRSGDFELCAPEIPQALSERAQGGMIQLLPHIDGTDGFFIAALRRKD